MIRFGYDRPTDVAEAVRDGNGHGVRYLAGGSNLVDLMKENVERPSRIVDINRIGLDAIEERDGGPQDRCAGHQCRYGMGRADRRKISGAGKRDPGRGQPAAAQRRDGGWQPEPADAVPVFLRQHHRLQQTQPGDGLRRDRRGQPDHAILGASKSCIATHPSDMCVGLAVLDATVNVTGPLGDRSIPFADYHRLPGDDPARDNT